jgi:hypothetical protein
MLYSEGVKIMNFQMHFTIPSFRKRYLRFLKVQNVESDENKHPMLITKRPAYCGRLL